MKILVALDPSTCSESALDFVARIRWPAGSRTLVLSVLQPVAGPLGPFDAAASLQESREQRRRVEVLVSHARRVLRQAGQSAEARLAEGSPGDVVVDVARDESVDLVVVGSRGRRGIARLLGSVSNHVVAHAPCSVLIVKSAREPGPDAARAGEGTP